MDWYELGNIIGTLAISLPSLLMAWGMHRIFKRTGHGAFWRVLAYVPATVFFCSALFFISTTDVGDGELALGFGLVFSLILQTVLVLVLSFKGWPTERIAVEVFE
ncbi:hypothetical protein [Algicella marina]|uniref:Uncharacterized protein n=1 Tax=Algicella marina TaxID=2683284 RepID=A0A6P1T279_9RHOB|nr:hypothetical protein [Algicella marina]QHQ34612.1 hypothetical protein GO499_05110 [Algicella marina]